MAKGEVHKGDIGTKFLVTFEDQGVVLPIAAATMLRIRFEKPNGTVVVQTATLETDGSDGKAKYVSVLNDLDAAGIWYLQGYVELGGGKWYSDVQKFIVHENLE